MNEVEARVALAAERSTIAARIRSMTEEFDAIVAATSDANVDDEHDPEGTTIAFERAQVTALLEQAQDHLADVDRAVERLTHGTYGVCTRCGQPISDERLAARPSAATCIRCATGR